MKHKEERRNKNRKESYAKVFLPDSHTIAYLRDLSREGVRIEAVDAPGFQAGELLKIVIIPIELSKISPFVLEVSIQWMGENGPTTSIGLALKQFIGPGSKRGFRRFYRFWRASFPPI